MSLSWRSRLFRVHLAADALRACEVRAQRGTWRVVRKVNLPFVAGGRATAMQALSAWMAESADDGRAAPRRASQEWVLGIADVRYLLLPWTPDLADEALRSALAAALFAQQFGEDPVGHDVRFAKPAYGCAQLVAFVPHSLLTEIDAQVRVSGIRLGRVVPVLAAVWERFHAVVHTEDGALHVVDGDRQLVVHHVRGRMRDVLLRPFDAGDEEAVLPAQSTAVRRRVFSTLSTSHAKSDAVLTLADAEGFSAMQDAAYSLALCGAL